MSGLDMTGHIDCAQRCEIPVGIAMREMPPTRHAWRDIKRCPNEDCGKFFMIITPEHPTGSPAESLTPPPAGKNDHRDAFRWHYGPTEHDLNPGSMWHYDCGGEVMGFKEGLICSKCKATDD